MFKVEGEACKAGKAFPRWYGQAVVAVGAWYDWLASEDWLGIKKVVMNDTHESPVKGWLASTLNDTLRFETKKVAADEWLAYQADIEDGADSTVAQKTIISLLRQGMVTDVSLGYVVLDYDWELARDPDNDVDTDTMVQTKIAPWEVSVTNWGAQGEDGNIKMAEKASMRIADDARLPLGAGPMRMYELAGDEVKPFDVKASKEKAEKALDERLSNRPELMVESAIIDRVMSDTLIA